MHRPAAGILCADTCDDSPVVQEVNNGYALAVLFEPRYQGAMGGRPLFAQCAPSASSVGITNRLNRNSQ
jgi:hypothetical protein